MAAVSEFPAFRKIPRLFRELIVTEKIDGTNGLVHIEAHVVGQAAVVGAPAGAAVVPLSDEVTELWVRAGSRNRWLTPESDNFGFAAWVRENAPKLVELGPGHHYGEWWGAGIQRRYGMDHKRFSLFNTSRWNRDDVILKTGVPEIDVVPVLEVGTGEWVVDEALNKLRELGSRAARGFDRPEGVVVYHTAANSYFKVTLDDDGKPKSA